MHKADESGDIQGEPARHNELLGGHGDDVIHAGGAGDVLWGDYKPSRPARDDSSTSYIGGPGKDFIYAGHGRNMIVHGRRATTSSTRTSAAARSTAGRARRCS